MISDRRDAESDHRGDGLPGAAEADVSKPLANPRHERFCLAIVNGHKLREAYRLAGYTGVSPRLSWELRHRVDVDARVRWLLEDRVKADSRLFARRQKTRGDLRERAIRELQDIAFADIGEVLEWRNSPTINENGEVVGSDDVVRFRDSASMPAATRKAVKGVFLKGGRLRVEMCDKKAALEALIRALTDPCRDSTPAFTVNQVNVGEMSAMEIAKRLRFALMVAGEATPPEPKAPFQETDGANADTT